MLMWIRPLLSGATGGEVFSALVMATSLGDATKRDAVGAQTTCQAVYQPDGMVYDGSAYLGSDIHNTTGVGQAHDQEASPNSQVTFLVLFYNYGNLDDTLHITALEPAVTRRVHYLNHATGADITDVVETEEGREVAVARDEYAWIRVEVSPLPGTPAYSQLALLVLGTPVGHPSKHDVVMLEATCLATCLADGMIYDSDEELFRGQDIYNTDGAGQTYGRSVHIGEMAAYPIRCRNGGNSGGKLRVVGPAGNPYWQIAYVNYGTGAGRLTPMVADGSFWPIRTR